VKPYSKKSDLEGDFYDTACIEGVEALVGTIRRRWSNISTNSPNRFSSIAAPASIEPAPQSAI